MKHLRIVLVCVMCTSLLTVESCTSFVGEKLLPIHAGVNVAKVLECDHDLADDKPFAISSPELESKSTYQVLVSEMRAADRKNRWVYLFKNDALLYWGYPYQFARHSDNEIRIAGEAMVKKLVELDYLDKEKD